VTYTGITVDEAVYRPFGLAVVETKLNRTRYVMIRFRQRFHDQAVKLFLYMAALGSIIFVRVFPGADSLELITADAQPSPQAMLVRVTTIMIAGSLTMLALGYSTPARTVPGP
jgi:hypothetical protein